MSVKRVGLRGFCKSLLFPFVVSLCALAAQAATTETAEDKTAQGDWTVSVAAGDTNIVTAAQTGSGKIVKQGGGVLILSKANTFSGGITLEAGYVFANESNCLGTGEIEIKGQREGYAGPCEIRFVASGKNYGAPPVHVTGNTTVQYPALMFVSATNTFSGTITADHDLYFGEDSQWLYDWYKAQQGSAKWSTNVSENRIMTFNGDICAAGTFHLLPDGAYTFNCNVTADLFETVKNNDNLHRAHNDSDISYYATITFSSGKTCRFNRLSYGYRALNFNGTLEGALITAFEGTETSTSSKRPGTITISQKEHINAALSVGYPGGDDYGDTRCALNGDAGATLTLTGTTANATCNSYMKLKGAVSLKLDAANNPGFTQVIRGRKHTMTGSVTIENGTLRLDRDTTFSAAKAFTVGANGCLEIDGTSTVAALAGVGSLTVNGAFKVEEGAVNPFKVGSTDLVIGPNSTLEIPSGTVLTVRALSVGATPKPIGTYTHNEIIQIPEGVQIVSTATKSVVSATWTGAASSDDLMSTMGNWLINDYVPETVDLTGGSLDVTVNATGSAMVPVEGTVVKSITFNRPPTKDVAPFVLGAAGTEITVTGKITSERQGQLILRGTIATPNHLDQGAATSSSAATIMYIHKDRGGISNYPPGTLMSPETSDYGAPIVLDGAFVEKPFYTYAEHTGGSVFYATTGSFNVLKGNCYCKGGGWHTAFIGENATVEIRGGYSGSNRLCKQGAGTLTVLDTPMTISSGLNIEGGRVVLGVADCTFGNTSSQNKGIKAGSSNGGLEFLCSNCIKDNDKEQFTLTSSATFTVDLHATTQRISRLTADNKASKSKFTGEYPAMLEIKGGTAWTDASYVLPTMQSSVQVTGALGIHYLGNGPASSGAGIAAGSEETFTLSGKAFESCGDLEVSGGTLALASGASWLNGTNFVARGTGTLKFGGSRQTNARFAVLTLEGADSKVEVAAGQTAAFLACSVNGTPVEMGEYTAATLPEGSPLKGRLTGSGTLRVGKFGLLLFVK